MKSATSVVALALLLAACQPPTQTAAAPPEENAAAGCNATAEEAWDATPDASFSMRAVAWGSTCKQAMIALALWPKDGPPAYSFISSMADIEGFDEVADEAALKEALAQWASGQADTTSRLPEWKAADPSPGPTEEFPFHPDEGVTQESYTAVRAANLPMFCFVQGQESQQCVYLQDDALHSIGVQQFPG
jgi:hypothetical protein